ncbi:MAG: bile acid:sodium symporter family protein [Marinilabiliaceae bacterium]|jgi:BASS family bile acid:Na+ symporter|nr:bile acid:sodium symporter family protein [Marinilabiliaceae bacterium]
MMNKIQTTKMTIPGKTFILVFLSMFISLNSINASDEVNGELLYKKLSEIVREGNNEVIEALNTGPRTLDWGSSVQLDFKGHLRYLNSPEEGNLDQTRLFFIRSAKEGNVYILTIPDREDPGYAGLEDLIESKLIFSINVIEAEVDGESYSFAQFVSYPVQPAFDKIFRLAIILMLFLVMVGMGLTLSGKDFVLVVTKPKGIIIGEILQFGVMPLIAAGFGYLMGFHENFPYIYVGMILITATPGGVTSNLMTHFAKGDVALSVSLTSLSTVLSIIFVPLLLNIYCSNIPDVTVPTGTIATTIIVLVIVPLGIGMLVRKWKETLAKKMIPVFNILGIVALLFLIIAGIFNNLEGFADTDRHGFRFYSMVLLLTFTGMFVGALIPYLLKVSSFQVRAISLETGLRNASLAMTIALLIQDTMGDFHSSMFWVSGMFGLTMYIAGVVAIKVYPKIFPVKKEDQE